MSENLIIKNFGPIKDIDIPLKKKMVFIGPQGSGKSVIAKVLTIFRHIYAKEIETEGNNDFIRHNIQNYLSNDSFIEYKTPEVSIKYKDKKFQTASANFLSKASLYIPTERILISMIANASFSFMKNDISLPWYITAFGDAFQKSALEIKELNINFLKTTYKNENGTDRVYYNDKDSIKLSESASGMQAVIPLLLTMEYVNKVRIQGSQVIFVVEEPELNLFPTAQKELVNYLVKKCSAHNDDLVLTTHSPYILSSLNILLFAWKVAQASPEKKEKVKQIIPEECWLNPADFGAYYVIDGGVKSILSESTGLIGENELDSVSEDLAGDFDQLMYIHREK